MAEQSWFKRNFTLKRVTVASIFLSGIYFIWSKVSERIPESVKILAAETASKATDTAIRETGEVLEGLGKSMAGKNEDSPEKKKGEVNSSAGKAPNSKAKKNDVSKQPSKVEQDYNKYKDYYESLLTHAHNKQNGRENSLDSYINQLKLEEAQGLINTLIHSRSRKEKLKNDCSEADVEALKKALIKRRDTLKTSSANFESGLEFKYVDVRPLSGKRLEDAISAAIKGEPNPAGTGKGKAA